MTRSYQSYGPIQHTLAVEKPRAGRPSNIHLQELIDDLVSFKDGGRSPIATGSNAGTLTPESQE